MANSTSFEIAAEIALLARKDLTIRTAEGNPRQIAEEGTDYAQSIAPVGTNRDPHPGSFRDSIHAEDIEDIDGMPAARIVSNHPAADYIEYGTSKTPEHGTFAATVIHMQQLEGGR